MSLAIVFSRASCGIECPQVTIEVHMSVGLPSFAIVGLPETAVKESRDRVRSAILNSNFEFPSRRITVNLAPADLPKKEGGRFDLPIALGILIASEQINNDKTISEYDFAGELALDGSLRRFNGVLPFAIATQKSGRKLIIPYENADEASLYNKSEVFPAFCLRDVFEHFNNVKSLLRYCLDSCVKEQQTQINYPDLADVYGQQSAKRALIISASGQHSLLMIGPPGTGKTMLASRLPGILPPMSEEEALEVSAVHSICGKMFDMKCWRQRPFRAPHHTASSVALVGGSNPPHPGEISLSHNGVLFLDELPEFSRHVLEALREPLESGYVVISRAGNQAKFPAKFQLVVAMNPCPCGNAGNSRTPCRCSQDQIQRYQSRISGPLLDRIDLHIAVPMLPQKILLQTEKTDVIHSVDIQKQVIKSRMKQIQRANKTNSQLNNTEIQKYCRLGTREVDFLTKAMEKFNLSARAYQRVLRVARTIADLEAVNKQDNSHTIDLHAIDKTNDNTHADIDVDININDTVTIDPVTVDHLAEALSYRNGLKI